MTAAPITTSQPRAAADTPAGSVVSITGTETEKGPLQLGCLYVSADAKVVACVHYVSHKGAWTATWSFFDLPKSVLIAQHTVFDSQVGGEELKAEEVAKVNERLKLGRFRAIEPDKRITELIGLLKGEGSRRTLTYSNKSIQVTLPPVTDRPDTANGRRALACCDWEVGDATEAGGHLAMSLELFCRYTGSISHRSDICYIAGIYEWEPFENVLISVPLASALDEPDAFER